ncbi:SycD/LcrH family type III secretion system chaperone [Chlamydiifrater phoenicopteri]|uniref:SycD/LcrH family type III secretion system chaperone n=1 Tax=Chlamydiifrater phoenicopteri TaxID=2681469 RepID=UPI001BCEF256|nr:SycD/LcrH family type III secretion system chaperone [Chlamydiifrater phoenicopteri]
MNTLSLLLERISLQSKEAFPFPENLEDYLEDFFPNPSTGLDTYQKIFNVSNEELELIYKEAYQEYLSGNYPLSTAAFRWLIFFNPFISKFWFSLGASLQMEKNFKKAIHAYAVTAIFRNKDPYPHYYAHLCYKLLNIEPEATKALEMAWDRATAPKYKELREELLAIKHSSESLSDEF